MNPLRALCVASLITALLVAGCSRPVLRETATFDIMGREMTLEVSTPDAPAIDRLSFLLRDEMQGMAKVLNMADPESEIRRVNRLAGSITLPVSKTISQILVLSKRAYKASGGAFDITLEPYMQVWGFRGGLIPEETPTELLDAAKSVLGMKRIVQRGDAVGFDNEVVSISVEPILEGYLADISILKLRGNLVDHAAVKIGRAMRVMGSKSPEQAWEFPVADPRDGQGVLGSLRLGGTKDRQAANSCHAFDPYLEGPSGKISWVIDPATGLPTSQTLFAMVVASTAFEADALSYALVVRGIPGAAELLSHFPRCEALIVPTGDPKGIWMTPGMQEIFTPAANLGLDVHEVIREPAEKVPDPPPPPVPLVEPERDAVPLGGDVLQGLSEDADGE